MKKVLSLVLVIAMVLSLAVLAGCGGKTEETKAEGGKIVMATNAAFPPYEYKENGQIIGIDVEIAQAIAKDMGMELEIEDIEFDSIITGVQTGKYDFAMAGLTITDERKQAVDFSETYATAKQVIIVKEDSTLTNFDDLITEGSTAGVQIGTTGDIYASDTIENGGLGSDKVSEFKTGNDAVLALVAGRIDCVIIDNEPAKAYVAANEGLKILETEYVEESYAAAFAKSSELKDKFNASLKKLTDDGTIKSIIDKYIKSE